MPTRRRRIALLSSVASGLLLLAAAEPLGWGPLAWVALAPLLVAVLRERQWRWAFAYGLVAAGVFFIAHLYWIIVSAGVLGWVSLALVLSVYVGVATLGAGIMRRWPLAPVLVAGAWTGMELVRDRWPLGGFSWGSVGTTQGAVPGVGWLAGVVGVYGLSFLCAFVAAVIADRIVSGRWAWGSVACVGVVLGVFIAVDVLAYGLRPPEGDTVRVGVVQGNLPRPPTPDQRDRILENHIALTRQLGESADVDLIVWAEDAVGRGVSAGADEAVSEMAREVGVPLLVGRSEEFPERRAFANEVYRVDAAGRWGEGYTKRHPVPFGEYVPFGFLRGLIGALDQVPYDMERGEDVRIFEAGGAAVGTPICFESVFPRDTRAFAQQGAELQIVLTNNASFGETFASDQHLAHARMRALELRQWVVQAALSGKSGVVAPDGSLSNETALFEQALFVAEVEARPAASLYARTGDLFGALWAFAALGALGAYASIVLYGRRRDAVGKLEGDEAAASAGE